MGANSIDDLIERGLITASEWHHESRSGERLRDKIFRCELTDEGLKELGEITGNFPNWLCKSLPTV